MGKHREVYCKICLKSMRSDNLQRHLKQHQMEYMNEECQDSTIIEETEASVSESGRNTTVANTLNTRVEDEELRKILEKSTLGLEFTEYLEKTK